MCGCLRLIAPFGATVGTAAYFIYRDKNVGDSFTDIRIISQIKSKLKRSTSSSRNVVVYVNNGTVLLVGRVPNKATIQNVLQVVWSVRGVKFVKNHIGVGNDISVVQKRIDCETTYMCKNVLMFTTNIKSPNIKIVTYNNVVYVLGLYRTASELNRILESIRFVKNVRFVVSYAELIDSVM